MYKELTTKELFEKRNLTLIEIEKIEDKIRNIGEFLIKKWDKIFNFTDSDRYIRYGKGYEINIEFKCSYIVFCWDEYWEGKCETLLEPTRFYGGSIEYENKKYDRNHMRLTQKELDDPVRTIEKWIYEKDQYDENKKVEAYIENELEEIENEQLELEYYLKLKNKYEKKGEKA